MPSAPVTSVRVPCIDGLVIEIVTPGITAPLASVILPLMAPVVVLTVCPKPAATDPSTRARTRRGTPQCSRLMRHSLIEIEEKRRPLPTVQPRLNCTDTTLASRSMQLLSAAKTASWPRVQNLGYRVWGSRPRLNDSSRRIDRHALDVLNRAVGPSNADAVDRR